MKKQTAIRLDSKLVERYRRLSSKTLMSVPRMIEHAMEDWYEAFDSMGNNLQRGLSDLKKQFKEEKI